MGSRNNIMLAKEHEHSVTEDGELVCFGTEKDEKKCLNCVLAVMCGHLAEQRSKGS